MSPRPDFSRLAQLVTAPLVAVDRFFDTVGARYEGTSPFKVVVEGATGADSFEAALRHAHDRGWFDDLVVEMALAGLFGVGWAETRELQAIVNRRPSFTDPALINSGLLRATARLCLVRISLAGGDEIAGTGFLVGPSAVLTAHHVIAPLLDPSGQPAPGSGRAVRLSFDFGGDRAKADPYRLPADGWLLVGSAPHPSELPGAGGAGTGAAPDLQGFLDYAVLSVVGCPGSERGFYQLTQPDRLREGDQLHVLQHPEEFPQRITTGVFEGYRAADGQRLLYTCDTTPGSSGGLVLDASFALIGLHHASVTMASGEELNSGIARQSIADDLKQRGVDVLNASLAHQYWAASARRPILGRDDCQQWIRTVAEGTKKVVRISPTGKDTGKSYTEHILKACLPVSEHMIGLIPASSLGSSATEVARAALVTLGVDPGGLPEADEANSTHDAWIRDHLLPDFRSRLTHGQPGRLCWLVIDDLSQDTLTDGTGRQFLSQLYASIEEFTNLRVVLIGLREPPSGLDVVNVADEEIRAPTEVDIRRYLRMRLVASDVDHTPSEVDRIADLICQSAGLEIKGLSDYVVAKVEKVIARAIDEQVVAHGA